jgi:hypothetical protein
LTINEGTETGTSFASTNNDERTKWYFAISAVNSAGLEGPKSSWVEVAAVSTANNPFLGPWSAYGFTIVFENTTWIFAFEDDYGMGTYTYTGNNGVLTDLYNGDQIMATVYGTYLTLILEDGTTLTLSPGYGTVSRPAAPTGLVTTGATTASISLSWNAVPGASGYRVYRSTSATGNYTLAGTTSATKYTDTGLEPNKTYYYIINAYNSAGESPDSDTVFAVTLSNPTTYISISGTPSAGSRLTATCYGSGWAESTIRWGWCETADGTFTGITSSYGSSTFTITADYKGKYIRAFRRHPDGPWDGHGGNIEGQKFYPSNFLGPIQ